MGVYAQINLPLSQQSMGTISMAQNIINYPIHYKLSIGEGYEDWAHIIKNSMSKSCYHKNDNRLGLFVILLKSMVKL